MSKPPLILEIPQDEGDEFPDYVLIRQGSYARAYAYPPGDDASEIFLGYQEALAWVCRRADASEGPFGLDIRDEMIRRGILIEIPDHPLDPDTGIAMVLAWEKDA